MGGGEQQLARLMERPLPDLMEEAAALRDAGHGSVVTFSPKVFIPLTRLCRDACGYCTFAQPPRPGVRAFMSLGEVLEVARLGAEQGCAEALFTLGDKPELLHPQAAAELRAMGFSSTLEYVEAAAAAVLAETGLLPHINAGVMGQEDLERLKHVSASQGLMLEGTSPALAAPGGPHAQGCPDKDPGLRLGVIEAAGRARVPFTSGLLLGIGESRAERLMALAALRELHGRHGHLQEVIIQNFRAKPNTPMHSHPEPPLEELLWTVAAARVLLGPEMSIQAPPNLTHAGGAGGGGEARSAEAGWRALLDAGINDWGGVSPVTRDYVNPEKPWPHLEPLAAATAAAGKLLLPRLPVYPRYLLDLSHTVGGETGRELEGGEGAREGEGEHERGAPEAGVRGRRGAGEAPAPWLSRRGGARSVAAAALRASDSSGLLRGSSWAAGLGEAPAPAGGAAYSPSEPAGAEQQQQQQMPQQRRLQQQLQQPATEVQQAQQQALQQQQQQQQQQLRPPVPPPRRRSWSISLGPLGTLDGAPAPGRPSPEVSRLLAEALGGGGGGRAWSEREALLLLSARGADMRAVVEAADALRERVCGGAVTYVVNRNINYTNVCTYSCKFCAFSKGKSSESLRGAPYLLPLEEVSRRAAEAWARGATEVCLQGGIHPDFTGDTYLEILAAAKAGAPRIHVHAFSPLEVLHGAETLGLPVPEYLGRLRDAGLGSLPGTAAEVLDGAVRAALCPDKLGAARWLEVVGAAHAAGLRTTSTIMFGHLDGPAAWARHLLALRDLQARTGGITEFVPLPFVHMESPIYLAGGARRGPTLRECVLMHAVARLVLHPLVTNIQASWVKMGPERAAELLAAGCNDMGGSIMNESITRAAGASFGQELPPARMEQLIAAAGRTPVQRTTLYGRPPAEQTAASFAAAPLAPAAAAAAGPAPRAVGAAGGGRAAA